MKDFEITLRVSGGNYFITEKEEKPADLPVSMSIIELHLDSKTKIEMVLVNKSRLKKLLSLGGDGLFFTSQKAFNRSIAFPNYISAYFNLPNGRMAHVYIQKEELAKMLNWIFEVR